MILQDDPFDILEIERPEDASLQMVKSSFRRLVFGLHEDRGGSGDGEAIARLVAARDRALEIVSGRASRSASRFEESLFQEAAKARAPAPEAPRFRDATTLNRGADVSVLTRVDRKVLEAGGRATAMVSCDCPSCMPSVRSPVCRVCGGAARLTLASRTGIVTGSCPACGGSGITTPDHAECNISHGSGHVTFDVPAGTVDGDTIRVPGRGMKGPDGAGDLLVRIDRTFAFLGRVEYGLEMTPKELRQGTTTIVTVPAVGDVHIAIAPGTAPGTTLYREIDGRLTAFRVRVST